jgi:hypothetical protein
MWLVGATAAPRILGTGHLPGKVNYFVGNDPAEWRTDIPTYARVKYEAVYPGVDSIYYGKRDLYDTHQTFHPNHRLISRGDATGQAHGECHARIEVVDHGHFDCCWIEPLHERLRRRPTGGPEIVASANDIGCLRGHLT